MPRIPIALPTQSSPARDPVAGNARLINCISEPAGGEAKVPNQVWACAGLSTFKTVTGDGGIRLLFQATDNSLIVVAGRIVSRIAPGGGVTVIGGIATTGPVYAAGNRRAPNAQVGIVSDGLYAVYEGGALTAITDPALPSPTSIDFLDGYFFFSEARGRITRCEADQASTFDGLAFTSAESSPDKLVGVITHERTLVAFGERSTEFYNADASVDPFAYSRSAAIEVGCAVGGSVARVQQTILWIADDLTVRRLNGYAGQKISTYSVDRFITSIADLSQVNAFTYTMGGNTYYTLTAPEGTWEYNLTTGLWHERVSIVDGVNIGRWRVSAVAEWNGQLIAGDYASPTLYVMSKDNQSEGDDPMVVGVQSPTISAFPYHARISAAYIDVVPGVGLPSTGSGTTTTTVSGVPLGLLFAITQDVSTTTGGGSLNTWQSQPSLIFDWSDDGGINWKPARLLPMGGDGETMRRIKTLRLGRTRSQGRVFRLQCSAAVVRGVLQMYADVERLDA